MCLLHFYSNNSTSTAHYCNSYNEIILIKNTVASGTYHSGKKEKETWSLDLITNDKLLGSFIICSWQIAIAYYCL